MFSRERDNMNQLDPIKHQISAIRKASGRQHYKVSVEQLCAVLDNLVSALEDRFSALEHAIEKPRTLYDTAPPVVCRPPIPGVGNMDVQFGDSDSPSPLRPRAEKTEADKKE